MSVVQSEIFDYDKNKIYLENLCRAYPFITPTVISQTSLGRSIFSLSIGNRKNTVLYAGGFHGSEWITSLVLYRFVENVCRHIKDGSSMCAINIAKALTHLGITVIPCVNPDGVEISVHGPQGAKSMRRFVESIGCDDYSRWNANAAGVDINHNFAAGWDILHKMEAENGITGPAPRQYGGEYAESEAETKALTRLCRLTNFRQAAAIHSQGEELYWQYGEKTPTHASMMAKILADSCSYKLVSNDGLASHGGFKDWFIEEFEKPAFTFEVGKGENPLPVSQLDEIYKRVEEAFVIFALM
ncbi:MAG: M14 family metallocarboxypeptidase [Acutalibacteraceae bacterium]